MLEYAVKALDAATDKASINSAVAKTTAEEVVGKEAQLEVAKDAALGRLEDYAEVKALANFTRSEKAAYNQALADEKAAIDAAANIDAVNTALKKAKADVNDALALILKDRADTQERIESIKTVTVNVATVNAKAINTAIEQAGGRSQYVTTIILGKKVKKISKGAFKNYKATKTLIVKTKKLKKAKVKNSLKGSNITKVKVQVGKKKANKKFVKKYKKIFTKKNDQQQKRTT